MAFNFSKNSASGAYPFSSHGPKSSRGTLNKRIQIIELINSRFLSGQKRFITHRGHKFEVKTSTTNQPVNGSSTGNGFDLGQVLLNKSGDLLKRFGGGLVASVLHHMGQLKHMISISINHRRISFHCAGPQKFKDLIQDNHMRTLQRHSRHTLSKDMAPLAKGTAFVDMFREKTLGAVGAKAAVWVAKEARRTRGEVFMAVLMSWFGSVPYLTYMAHNLMQEEAKV